MSSKTTPIIALITNDIIGEQMAGPGIRYWEFARVLGQHVSVKLIVPPFVSIDSIPSPDSPSVSIHVCTRPQDLRHLAEECDVIVTLGAVLFFYPFLTELGKPLVVDLYSPFLLEGLQREAESDLLEQLTSHENYLDILKFQLWAGDFFLCSGAKQRDYWLGMLSIMDRVNPYTYCQDPTLRRLIDIVPFGLPQKLPQHNRPVLKGVYKTIGPKDNVILWGGGIWNWLDAPTIIKAMPLILQHRAEVKLFFMGVNRPNKNVPKMKAVDEAVALSKKLGLYEQFVFFNDWVSYDDRQNYLLEADIGLSLHLDHAETRFSFRTRMLDYLWAGLPIVSTRGDMMSQTLAAQNLAHLVAPGDVEGVAQTVLTLLNNPTLRDDHLARFQQVARQYQWEVVARPLVEFCTAPSIAPDKPYLSRRSFSNAGRNSSWRLLTKSWRALRLGGLSGFLRQSSEYLRWKLKA